VSVSSADEPRPSQPTRRLTVYETGIADVVNELNNRLTAIIGLAELTEHAADTDDERDALAEVAAEARRAAAIVRDLGYLVRPPRAGEGAAHLGQAIEAVLRRRTPELAALDVKVTVEPLAGLPLIAVESDDLEMLLARVLAFGEARLRDAPPPRRIRLAARPIGASVLLTQTDTGPPLPAGHVHELHYFRPADPGFLGHVELALAQRVAETCGAGVRLETGPDGAAELNVTLIPSTLLAPPPRRGPAEPPAGARVLVAEDDAVNRRALAKLLERSGYSVTAVADGAQALAHLEEETPDLLLLDLQMPALDGREVFRRVAARWPALARRVVFVTGDETRAASGDFLRESGQPVVRKPYEIADLLATLAELHGTADSR
jgi:two-component system NtrC family sensor kinase